METHKHVGDRGVGVVYGDRKIHNSLEWQNSISLLYLQQVYLKTGSSSERLWRFS